MRRAAVRALSFFVMPFSALRVEALRAAPRGPRTSAPLELERVGRCVESERA